MSFFKRLLPLIGAVAALLLFGPAAPVSAQPSAGDVALQATGHNTLTDDDLVCSYTLTDATTVSVNFYRNGSPTSVLYLPIEGGDTGGLNDYSGNSHTVTASSSTATAWQATGGHDGHGAFAFHSGTGAFHLDAGKIFPTQSSYSKVAWVKRTGSGSNNIMSGASTHVLYASTSSQGGCLAAGQNGTYNIVKDPVPLVDGTWYFVVLTFDYVTGEMILYKDAVEVDRDTATVAQRELLDSTVYIGAFAASSQWEGLIDEARIYDYVLTPDQITALYSGPTTIAASETSVGDTWYADVTPFSSSAAGTTVASNTLTINDNPPIVSDIPDQGISEGNTFATISLDDYVTDGDHADNEMSWTFSGNDQLSVAIVDRVATITIPSSDWYGAETVTFRATDPGGLYNEDAATFTVANVNDPPVVSDIPDDETDEGTAFASISLDDFVEDIDNADAEITWTYSGNSNLTVTIVDRVATVSPTDPDWYGTETITFTATDPGDLYDEDAATFTVNPVNDPPVVAGIPDQTVAEGSAFAVVDLGAYVSDVDNVPGDMTWSYSGSVDLDVSIDGDQATITPPDADWNGAETITFTAEDPGSATGSDDALFTVTAVNDPPIVGDIPDQLISPSGSFATIALDDFVSDPDNADDEISWAAAGNVNLDVTIVGRVATVTVLTPGWQGSETITFTGTDPGSLSDADAATFTVVDPTVSGVVLAATSPGVLVEDDLFCTYTLEGSATTAATAWLRNGEPLMVLYAPVEGGSDNALLDFSGSGNDMTGAGDPLFVPTGGHDGHGAWELDGNDYIEAGECFPTSSSYTITAWLYRTGPGSNNVLSGDIAAGGHVFFASSSSQQSCLAAGHNNIWNIVKGPDSLLLNQWYFAAVTFDYATGEMILYQDGVPVDTGIADVNHRDVTDPTAEIGSFMNSSQWVGSIDDARIYGSVLSAAQIQMMYSTGVDWLASGETAEGDVWQALVTPFSESDQGVTVASNELTISAYHPEVIDVELSATTPLFVTTDDLTCTYTLQGTATTAAVNWFRNGSPVAAFEAPMEGGEANGLLDISGNGHDMTAVGDPAWGAAAGHDGRGAYVLDGNDHFDVGDVFPTASSYTKTAWVYRTGESSANIMSGELADGGHVFYASTSSQGGSLCAGHDGNFDIVKDPVPLDADTWYFVAVTFDYGTGEMVLYRDGVEVDRDTAAGPEMEVVDPKLYIGAFAGSSQLIGAIDDPRLYDFVLSPEQIEAMYVGGGGMMAAEETAADDEWQAQVIPFSDVEMGAPVMSNAVTIIPNELTAPAALAPPETLDSIVYDMRPTFSWAPSTNPHYGFQMYYRLCLSESPDFTFVATVDSLTDTTYAWPDSLEFAASYCWKVEAWVDLDTTIQVAHSDTLQFYTWTLGDLDHSRGVNVSDLTMLVAFLFQGGEAIEPPFVADLDASCDANVSDLTYLVAYLFQGGPDPLIGCE